VNEALGVVELSSIARGVVVADAMVKKAPVTILQSHPTSPGKYVVVVEGGVAEVDEALRAGLAVAQALLVDRLFLPHAHPQLGPLVAGRPASAPHDSIAIVETFTICAAILAADAAAKAADVTLLDMRLGQGLGGKAFFTMTGDLESIQAAADAGEAVLDKGLLVGVEIIAAPHDDLAQRLMW
jgi:microcompartment protein CcmL/EutN